MEPTFNVVELLQKIKLMQKQIDSVQLLVQQQEKVLYKIDERVTELKEALERAECEEEESLTDEDWDLALQNSVKRLKKNYFKK